MMRVLEGVKADHARSVEDLRLLTEIEAPPFKEQKRAEAFLARMRAVGLSDAAASLPSSSVPEESPGAFTPSPNGST